MRDRIRWYARGAALDAAQLVTLVQHVEHWSEQVQRYDLLVPRDHDTFQLYGELLILEHVAVRGALPDIVTKLLDALAELIRLLPGATMQVFTNDVVFVETPMGFDRQPRTPEDDIAVSTDGWIRVAEVVTPPIQPLLTMAEEAERQALPLVAPDVISTELRFENLDWDDDATAIERADSIWMRHAASFALSLVAALRDRPRSEEQQRVFDSSVGVVGVAGEPKTAPTLILLLEGLRGEPGREPIWCEAVLRTVEKDERTRDEAKAVRDLLAERSTTNVLTLSAERRAQLRAYEVEDLEYAKQIAIACDRWFTENRERLEELKVFRKPPTDPATE